MLTNDSYAKAENNGFGALGRGKADHAVIRTSKAPHSLSISLVSIENEFSA